MTTMIYIRGLLFMTGVTGCCCSWCRDCCVYKNLISCTAVVVAVTPRTGAVYSGNICPVCKGGAVTIRTTILRCPGSIVVICGRSGGVKTVYQVRNCMVAASTMGMAVKVARGMTLVTVTG